jgi:hypothetical protein
MKTSDQINELATALAKAQGEFPDIPKDKTAKVKGESKSGKPYDYSYKYSDLTTIIKYTRPALTKYGLSLIQVLTADSLFTRLVHSSGQFIEGVVPIRMNQKMQDVGSDITYLKRYSLSAMIGVSSEDDDDKNPPIEAQQNSKHSGQRGTALTETKVQGASAASSVPPRPLTGPALPPGSSQLTPSNQDIEDFQAFLRRQGWTNRDAVDLIQRTYGKTSPRVLKLSELDQIAEIIKTTPINKTLLDEPQPPTEEWNPPLEDLEGGAPR